MTVAVHPSVLVGIGPRSVSRVRRAHEFVRRELPDLLPFMATMPGGGAGDGPDLPGEDDRTLPALGRQVLRPGVPTRGTLANGLRPLAGRWRLYVLASLEDDPLLGDTADCLQRAVADIEGAGVVQPRLVVLVDLGERQLDKGVREALAQIEGPATPTAPLVLLSGRQLSSGGWLDALMYEEAIESALAALLTSDAISPGEPWSRIFAPTGDRLLVGTFGAVSAGYQQAQLIDYLASCRAPAVLAQLLLGTDGGDDGSPSGDLRLVEELRADMEGRFGHAAEHLKAELAPTVEEALKTMSAVLVAAEEQSLHLAMAEAATNFQDDWLKKQIRPAGVSALQRFVEAFKRKVVHLVEEAALVPGGLPGVRPELESALRWLQARRVAVQKTFPEWRIVGAWGAAVTGLRKRRLPLIQAVPWGFLAAVVTGQTLLGIAPDALGWRLNVGLLGGLGVIIAVAVGPLALVFLHNELQRRHIRVLPAALKQEAVEFLEEYYEWLGSSFVTEAGQVIEEALDKVDDAFSRFKSELDELRKRGPETPDGSGWNIQLLSEDDFRDADVAFSQAVTDRKLLQDVVGRFQAEGASHVLSMTGDELREIVLSVCSRAAERFLKESGKFEQFAPGEQGLSWLLDELTQRSEPLLRIEEEIARGRPVRRSLVMAAAPQSVAGDVADRLFGAVVAPGLDNRRIYLLHLELGIDVDSLVAEQGAVEVAG